MNKKLICPHCGSKDVEKHSEYFVCNSCKNSFGRVALSDEGIPMVDAVTGLRFRYGDIVSGSVRLRMIQEKDGSCVYEVYDANEGSFDKVADVLSKEDWTRLKDWLFNELYLLDWNKEYIPENNAIELSENNYNITINHELFHASTTINDKDTEMIYCGFQQISNKKKKIGEGLNEGYTQYLTEKYFGKENSLNTAYTYEKRIAETLEIIVGKEKMQSLYFNANLHGLVEYLKKYAPEYDIYKFISTLDFLNEHMGDKYLIPSSKEMIKSGYKFINSFLIKTALRKNIIDNPASQLSTEEVFKCLIPILTLIPNSVKSKNDSFQISDDNLIHGAFTSVLSEYEMSDDRRTISK